jgi:predicted nucleotidyltransferase
MFKVNPFETSLRNLVNLLADHGIKYMVIGGLANAKWGNPRVTLDIDITIWVSDDRIGNLLYALKKDYTILVDKPLDFISNTRVLPVQDNKGQRIDLIFGSLPFEENAIDRAIKVEIGTTTINFCTAEDLILLKIISDRDKDIEDVRGILKFQKETLDYDYLEPRITELTILLDKPDIKRQWEKWKKEQTKVKSDFPRNTRKKG